MSTSPTENERIRSGTCSRCRYCYRKLICLNMYFIPFVAHISTVLQPNHSGDCTTANYQTTGFMKDWSCNQNKKSICQKRLRGKHFERLRALVKNGRLYKTHMYIQYNLWHKLGIKIANNQCIFTISTITHYFAQV